MLLELKLDTRNWVNLLPVIQTNLNQSPMISLSWHALIELFTGLPAPSLLDTIVIPDDKTPRVLPVNLDRLDVHLQKLRNYLAEIQQEVVDRKERKRLYQLGQAEGIVCNFAIGNSVLWSRVDKRMRVYADAELIVTAEICEHVASQGIISGIRAIVNLRFDIATQELQLVVAWCGLENI
ncbi:hypothetical protein CCR75_004014 [Bremia lactucae]|uniref:Uncharacterized protein n=1 Tax=Bremia lactucae TaxID=4779 RepID=A0A976FEB0_BRELC|nr:hypothetical protein CCR75_004014 [Bremia lactucae]